MQDKFGQILVPMEEVVEMREGQKRRSERKFFPGYVLVQMEMDDETWHLVKALRIKVTGKQASNHITDRIRQDKDTHHLSSKSFWCQFTHRR